MLPGCQIAASYTFSQTELTGSAYGLMEGLPFASIQPELLYKLWTSYDFHAAGAMGWLSNLSISAGFNGQSKGYKAGSTCPDGHVGQPNPFTGIAPCLVALVPYEFTVKPYTVVSGRIDCRLNERWSATLNLENIFDRIYYESVDGVSTGNWYGKPRRVALSLRGKW